MADTAHSSLTGSDLHEPKGASTAANDTVGTITSNSVVWKKLTVANLDSTANPFGAGLLHIRNEQNLGVNGSVLSSSAWALRTLNTVKLNQISEASLVSNSITLPAGTYMTMISATLGAYTGIAASTNAYNYGKLRLYNTTTSTSLIDGMNTHIGVTELNFATQISGRGNLTQTLNGTFTLAGTSSLKLENYTTANAGTNNEGFAQSVGIKEVYSDVLIWKIA